jgi:uncharacterized protein
VIVKRALTTCLEERSLAERLEPRIEIEQYFEQLGHTYRHGRLHRVVEHRITIPILKRGLQLAGLYSRGVQNALSPVVRKMRLRFPNLPPAMEGFRILHLSDFHIDGNEPLADVLSTVLHGARCDICVLTGDYRFEDRGPCGEIYPLMRAVLSSISAKHGIFGILGNHDYAEIAFALEEMGVQMLVNEAVPVPETDGDMWLIGVDDPYDYGCDDLPGALSSVPPGSFKILLAHAPELYEEAADHDIDLYLCGHTHAGQIRLPLIGSVRHNAKCPKAYSYGHWRHGSMQGYTSAGVGCSSLRVRFNCPPEIVLIELRAADRSLF